LLPISPDLSPSPPPQKKQAASEPLSLSDAQSLSTATALLSLKAAPSLLTLYKVYAGLAFLNAQPNAPLAVSLPSPTLQPNQPLTINVNPLLGTSTHVRS
jgi:hypothetical protein